MYWLVYGRGGREVNDFSITIELHLGLILSPYLFTLVLVLNVPTKNIQKLAPKCIFFVDDTILFGESKEDLNERMKIWRHALKVYNFF